MKEIKDPKILRIVVPRSWSQERRERIENRMIEIRDYAGADEVIITIGDSLNVSPVSFRPFSGRSGGAALTVYNFIYKISKGDGENSL